MYSAILLSASEMLIQELRSTRIDESISTICYINLNAIKPFVRFSGLDGVPHRDKSVRLAGKEGDRLDVERASACKDVDNALPRRSARRPEVAQ